MFFYEGLSCPHCQALFNETDDIVACPVCGAPHHRHCWTDGGGCACAEAHGTDEQWSRERASRADTAAHDADDHVACPHCGNLNSPFAEICGGCGAPLDAKDWGEDNTNTHQAPPPPYNEYAPFHAQQTPCGGVSPDAVIEDETARDLAEVVRTNQPYYLPRFERMGKTGSKLSWNWAAFFIPSYWLLFRKQYLVGAAVLALDIAQIVIVQLLAISCFAPALNTTNPSAMFDAMLQIAMNDERAQMALSIVSAVSLTLLCVRLLVGMFGNRLYMKHCLKTIRSTRELYPEGYHAQLALVGGTSPALALVGYMCVQLLPNFVLMLFL